VCGSKKVVLRVAAINGLDDRSSQARPQTLIETRTITRLLAQGVAIFIYVPYSTPREEDTMKNTILLRALFGRNSLGNGKQMGWAEYNSRSSNSRLRAVDGFLGAKPLNKGAPLVGSQGGRGQVNVLEYKHATPLSTI